MCTAVQKQSLVSVKFGVVQMNCLHVQFLFYLHNSKLAHLVFISHVTLALVLVIWYIKVLQVCIMNISWLSSRRLEQDIWVMIRFGYMYAKNLIELLGKVLLPIDT